MKIKLTLTLAALGLAACLQPVSAQLTIPSDGSDGALILPTSPTNVVIDLSLATPGVWDANNSANAGRGIYDSNKWAIVFKYSEVNIPAGVTVRFLNHPSRAPVVWLVQRSVTNLGRIHLEGADTVSGVGALVPPETAPGGFRGGASGPQGDGSGLGPGGSVTGGYTPSGGYLYQYGNPKVLPLIGGSGGSGSGRSGGAGGGAILIAAADYIWNQGLITTKGGQTDGNAGGSGGAVKLIATQVLGSGEVNCMNKSQNAQPGRIRIEANHLDAALRTFPETIAVPPATPPVIWPPDTSPKVVILSVHSATDNVPPDPTAPLTSTADVAIENNGASRIRLRTENFPLEGVVEVRVARKWGTASWVRAYYESGNQAEAFWRATNTFVRGYSTLQARATAP